MATFATIDAKDAPAPEKRTPSSLAARMREYESYVTSVKKGQVGKLVPGSTETARGLALRISRAGGRVGKGLDSWVVDGAVYFKPR